jgi:hypothetical protein
VIPEEYRIEYNLDKKQKLIAGHYGLTVECAHAMIISLIFQPERLLFLICLF